MEQQHDSSFAVVPDEEILRYALIQNYFKGSTKHPIDRAQPKWEIEMVTNRIRAYVKQLKIDTKTINRLRSRTSLYSLRLRLSEYRFVITSPSATVC